MTQEANYNQKLQKIMTFNKGRIVCGRSQLGYGFSQFAKRRLRKGELVVKGFGRIIDHQTNHISIQIDVDKHFLPNKWTGRYWNHSCDPTCFVSTRSDGFPHLIALKEIAKGEEITYSYWMTEYEWSKQASESFISCKCGSPNCSGAILSFSQLPEDHSMRLKNLVSKYLTYEGFCSANNLK